LKSPARAIVDATQTRRFELPHKGEIAQSYLRLIFFFFEVALKLDGEFIKGVHWSGCTCCCLGKTGRVFLF